MAWYHWLNPVKLGKEGYKEVVKPIVSPIVGALSTGWNAVGGVLGSGINGILGSDAASLFNTAWTSADPKLLGDYVERNIDKADKLSSTLFSGNLSAIPALALESAVDMSMGTVQSANKMMAWTGVMSKTISGITHVDFTVITNKMKEVLVEGVAEDLPDLLGDGRVDINAKRLLEKVLSLVPLGVQSGTVSEIEQKAIQDKITFAFGVFFDAAGNEISAKANGGIFCDLAGDWGFFGEFGGEQEDKLSAPSLTLSLQVFVVNGPRDIFKECKVITVPVGGSVEAGPVFYKDSDKFVGMKYSYGKGPAVFNKKQELASSSAQYLANDTDIGTNNIVNTANLLSGQTILWSAVMDASKSVQIPDLSMAALNGSERAVLILSPNGKYLSLSADGSGIELVDKPNQNSMFTAMSTGVSGFSSPFVEFNPLTINAMQLGLNSCLGTIIRTVNNKYLYDARAVSTGTILDLRLSDTPCTLTVLTNGFDNYLFHEPTTQELAAKFTFGNTSPLYDLLYFIPVERKEIGLRVVATDDYVQANTLQISTRNKSYAYLNGEDSFILIKLGGSQIMLQEMYGRYLKLDGARLTFSSKRDRPDASCVFTMEDKGNGAVSIKALTGNYYLSRDAQSLSVSADLNAAAQFYVIDFKGRAVGLRTYYADNPLTAVSIGAVVNYKPDSQWNAANIDSTIQTRLKYESVLPQQVYGLSLINLGKSASGKDQFAFKASLSNSEYSDGTRYVLESSVNLSFNIYHPENPEIQTAVTGSMNNSFEIEQEGDIIYFKSSFSNHYLAINTNLDDGSTHQLVFSSEKYPWDLIDLKGSFVNFNLAVYAELASRERSFAGEIISAFSNILNNITVLANTGSTLQWISSLPLQAKSTLQLIKIKNISDDVQLIALRTQDAQFVTCSSDLVYFSKSLNTLSFFYLCKTADKRHQLRSAYFNKPLGINPAANNSLYLDGANGFIADANNSTFVIYDPLYIRQGEEPKFI